MRIVNRVDFMALSAGTVFSKYRLHIFDAPQIKSHSTPHNDFWSIGIGDQFGTVDFGDYLIKITGMLDHGESVPLDFSDETRDGLYDADQLFAIWERHDVENFIARLAATLT